MACTHEIWEMDTAVGADGFCPLCQAAEIVRLQAELRRIVDHFDMATELYTSDADLAAGIASIARLAI